MIIALKTLYGIIFFVCWAVVGFVSEHNLVCNDEQIDNLIQIIDSVAE